jgi:hypothetical protein
MPALSQPTAGIGPLRQSGNMVEMGVRDQHMLDESFIHKLHL